VPAEGGDAGVDRSGWVGPFRQPRIRRLKLRLRLSLNRRGFAVCGAAHAGAVA
jgi:hypothetical protein